MQRKNKKWIIIVLILVWGLLLLFLTPIILLFVNQNLEVSYVPTDMAGDHVNYAIDNWSYYDNIVQTITIDGWAFVETQQDNLHKTVKFVFVSDVISYEVDADLHNREGLVKVFTDKYVPKNRTGFSITFSPLGMRNGDYTLFIYIYENENNYGIKNTGREFQKYYRNFTELKGGVLLDSKDFSKASENNSIKYNIDWCYLEDGKLDIYGWAFLENAESSENRVYLEIQKPDGTVSFYSTKRFLREGVGEYFSDNRYIYSGFQAKVPIIALGQGDNIITVFIGTDNRAVNGYTFYWDGSGGSDLGSTPVDGTPPMAFNKIGPYDGAVDLSLTELAVSWNTSNDASSYEVCVDATDNDTCDTTWLDVGDVTEVVVPAKYLNPDTTYYWQVRAVNAYGTTYADDNISAFWTGTTEE